MDFNFSQNEVEARLYKCLEYGDEIEISKRIDRSPTLVSQMVNPDDERESDFYKALKFIVGFMDLNFERGFCAYRLFCLMVERHLPTDAKMCVQTESVKFNGQLKEYLDSVCNGEPPEIRISELDDVIRQAVALKRAYQAEVKKEIQKHFEVSNNLKG